MADTAGSNPVAAKRAGSTPVLGTSLERKIMIEATDETFDQELVSDIPVIVDFWAEWCGPCKSLAPIFQDLASDYGDRVKFVKVNTDDTTVAAKYNIRGIPTILFFKDGHVVNTIIGSQTKGRLQLAIDTVLA